MSGNLEEIGRRLRAARESRGLSLATAEEETKIRRKYLEALEAGARAELPDEVYVKGFLRTYGNYLGLEGVRLVEEYKRASQGAPADADTAAPAELPPRPAEAVVATRAPGGGGASRRTGHRPRPRPLTGGLPPGWVVGAAALGLVALVLWWAPWTPPPQAPPAAPAVAPPAPPQLPPPVPPAPVPVPEVPVRVEVGAPVNSSPVGPYIPVAVSPGPIRLTLRFRDRAWVKVEADGKGVVEGTFTAGKEESFTAAERLEVTVGWVEVVDFTINGKGLGAVAREPHRRVIMTVTRP